MMLPDQKLQPATLTIMTSPLGGERRLPKIGTILHHMCVPLTPNRVRGSNGTPSLPPPPALVLLLLLAAVAAPVANSIYAKRSKSFQGRGGRMEEEEVGGDLQIPGWDGHQPAGYQKEGRSRRRRKENAQFIKRGIGSGEGERES